MRLLCSACEPPEIRWAAASMLTRQTLAPTWRDLQTASTRGQIHPCHLALWGFLQKWTEGFGIWALQPS